MLYIVGFWEEDRDLIASCLPEVNMSLIQTM